ncbi:Carboxylesterase family-domain-containing protein [Phyllosticta citricarpa]
MFWRDAWMSCLFSRPKTWSSAAGWRGRAPVAPEPRNDVLNATTFGAACAQPANSADIFSSTISSSEVCLYLNVWTPTYNETNITFKDLPVLVWTYGGRFEASSGDVKPYDGSSLASKDIIVATLNCRVGLFGSLAHLELNEESGHNASGNYGLLDQQFALKWVQENIANFGRNPNQVTVGVDFVKNSLNVSIAEVRNVTTDTLLDYVNESDTIFESTKFANDLSGNDHTDVPILTGNNKDESGASPDTDYNATAYKTLYPGSFGGNFSSRFFELYLGSNVTEASANSNEFFRDLSRVGAWRWSVDWAGGGVKSNFYTYYFTTAPAEDRDEGAYHGAELWYTFNNIL